MDSIRKKIFPNPTYSDRERDAAYRSFALIASYLSKAGVPVILDGTGHKVVWRKFARKECPKFVEVYLKCPIEICIERESKRTNNNLVRQKLYATALARLKKGKRIQGLGKMPGVDERYEESSNAEIILDSSLEKPKILAEKAIEELAEYAPSMFSI
jgi:adenylylsulfate kinase